MKQILIALGILVFLNCCNNANEINISKRQIDSLTSRIDTLQKKNKLLLKQLQYEESPEQYGVEILHIGGIGSHQVQLQAYYLTEHGYFPEPKKWVKYAFNSPVDVIHIMPIAGYRIDKISRLDNNDASKKIDCNETDFCSGKIYNTLQNKFHIVMIKTGYENYLLENK